MAVKNHSLLLDGNLLTVKGVVKVEEITPTQAQFKLENTRLVVKGTGLNVVKLDREQGVVVVESSSIGSLLCKSAMAGIKGFFK